MLAKALNPCEGFGKVLQNVIRISAYSGIRNVSYYLESSFYLKITSSSKIIVNTKGVNLKVKL